MTHFDPSLTTNRNFTRVSSDLSRQASSLSSSTIHEAAGRIGQLPSAIKPVDAALRICGPALPVQSPGGDNLWLHRAIYAAEPGDILVVEVGGAYEYGYWGEIMATAAQVRKIAGLIIDACVRDGKMLSAMQFPVFARGLCIRGTGKDFGARGTIGHSITIGDTEVKAGDLICGDSDGVVCIPRESAPEVIRRSYARDATEAQIVQRLHAGETTLKIYSWD